MTLDMFLQHCFNALTLGSLYALIAIGYTMVYGILRLINFAHGDILMVGAYFVFFGTFAYGWPWGVAAIIAILGASVLGVVVERVAYRPLRDAPRISALISAIAVSFSPGPCCSPTGCSRSGSSVMCASSNSRPSCRS